MGPLAEHGRLPFGRMSVWSESSAVPGAVMVPRVRPLILSLVCCRSTNGQENLKIRSSLHWENLTRQG